MLEVKDTSPEPLTPEVAYQVNSRLQQSQSRKYRKEMQAWSNMKSRCRRKKNWKDKGIQVCQQWQNSFRVFLADVGPCPEGDYSLDRFPDRDGDYEPGNVRWATRVEQANNKTNNVLLEFDGQRLSLGEWSKVTGIPYGTLNWRLKAGWEPKRILEPVAYPSRF